MKVAITSITIGALAGLLLACTPVDAQRAEIENLGVRFIEVFADPQTGCQYLVAYQKTMTPRLAPDGRQVCVGAKP